MADENIAGPSIKVEDADALAKTPTPKKQRAPRRQKASAETTVVSSPVTRIAGRAVNNLKKRSRRPQERTSVTRTAEEKECQGRPSRPFRRQCRRRMRWRILFSFKKRIKGSVKLWQISCVRKMPTCASGLGSIDRRPTQSRKKVIDLSQVGEK